MKKNNIIIFIILPTILYLSLWYLQMFVIKEQTGVAWICEKAQFVIHFFLIVLVMSIYKKATMRNRKILVWLVITSIFLFLNDIAFFMYIPFNLGVNINIPQQYFLFNFIFYITWLITAIIFLYKMSRTILPTTRILFKVITPFLILDLIIIILFTPSIYNSFGTVYYQNFLIVIGLILGLVIFSFSILFLIYSANIAIALFMIGLIILISGDFLITFARILHTLAYGDLLWILGVWCMFCGLVIIKNGRDYNIRNWFMSVSSIKSTLTIWSFIISFGGFILFFIAADILNVFNGNTFIMFPPFIAVYSIIIVGLSIIFGRKFEIPFKQIQSNIKNIMINNEREINNYFQIREFALLQRYFMETYSVKEKQEQLKRNLGDIASKVVHDIRTPLTVINNLMESITLQVPVEQSHKIHEQLTQIRQTVNNLLEYNRKSLHQLDHSNEKSYIILANIIESVMEQKKIEWQASEFKIKVILDCTRTIWLYVAEHDFKNMLSNLLNNAYEAMQDKKVEIEIYIENETPNQVNIYLKDNGIGIPKHQINNVLHGKSLKHSGNGIGLLSAVNYIKSLNGNLIINSQENNGTTVTISLPKTESPSWYPHEIKLPRNNLIVIVDDDPMIHTVWQTKLFTLPLDTIFFTKVDPFVNWYSALNEMDKVTVFMDYNLHNVTTGLDILINLEIKFATLVTNCSDQAWLQSKVSETPYFMIPKRLLAEIPIILC